MTEHTGCILAIVGSRDVPGIAALKLIHDVLEEHRPIIVVSGGAKASGSNKMRGLVSIDEEAARMARKDDIQLLEFLPTTFKFHGEGGFAERNMKIAETCVCLVRIASETTSTYGSGWTADRAEELGKYVRRYTIMANGTVVDGQIEVRKP